MSCEIMNKILSVFDDKSIKIDTIANKLDISTKSVCQSVGKLIDHGYVTRSCTGVYRLTDKGKSLKNSGKTLIINPGPEKGYQWPLTEKDTFRARAWRAMRIKQKFTVNDILTLAVNGDEKQPINQLHIYIKALVSVGFLIELHSREPGYCLTSPGFKRFAIIEDAGYIAPIFRRKSKEVYNPNNGEVLPCRKA